MTATEDEGPSWWALIWWWVALTALVLTAIAVAAVLLGVARAAARFCRRRR